MTASRKEILFLMTLAALEEVLELVLVAPSDLLEGEKSPKSMATFFVMAGFRRDYLPFGDAYGSLSTL